MPASRKPSQLLLGLLGILGLVIALFTKNFDFLRMENNGSHGFYRYDWNNVPWVSFFVNKLMRFMINTGSVWLVAQYLLNNMKLARLVLVLQAVILLTIFPVFLLLAFHYPSSFNEFYLKLNALIINPVVPVIAIFVHLVNHK